MCFQMGKQTIFCNCKCIREGKTREGLGSGHKHAGKAHYITNQIEMLIDLASYVFPTSSACCLIS